MSTNPLTHGLTNARRQWAVSYSQGDVDAIREQIELTESSKRRLLILAFLVTLAALVGTIILLGNAYRLYSSSESSQKSLAAEAAAQKLRADQTQQKLDTANTALEERAREVADDQARLARVLPAVVGGSASGAEIATFARLVHNLPRAQITLDQKPPDGLFRNWKVSDGKTTEIYTLVGGLVDGKWVVCSNLVSRRNVETVTP
jgi:hypothetical protein